MEKDPVRFNDSLEAFEEVLKIAKAQNVRSSYAATPLFGHVLAGTFTYTFSNSSLVSHKAIYNML